MRKAILVFTVLGLVGSAEWLRDVTQALIYCFPKGAEQRLSLRALNSTKWLEIQKNI